MNTHHVGHPSTSTVWNSTPSRRCSRGTLSKSPRRRWSQQHATKWNLGAQQKDGHHVEKLRQGITHMGIHSSSHNQASMPAPKCPPMLHHYHVAPADPPRRARSQGARCGPPRPALPPRPSSGLTAAGGHRTQRIRSKPTGAQTLAAPARHQMTPPHPSSGLIAAGPDTTDPLQPSTRRHPEATAAARHRMTAGT